MSFPSTLVNAARVSDDSFRIEIGQIFERCKGLIAYRSMCTCDSALALLDSSAVLIRNHLGDEDTLLAEAYHWMSLCLHSQGKYDSAAIVTRKMIDIWKTAPGGNHVQILKGFDVLVEGGLRKNDLIRCEQTSEQRFEILDGLPEPLSTAELKQLVDALNDRGRLRVQQSRFDEAIEDFNRGLDLITDDLKEGPELRASLTGNIGWTYGIQGKFAEAEDYITKALEQVRVVHHPKFQHVMQSFSYLSDFARKQGKLSQANVYADSALALSFDIYGFSHPGLTNAYQTKAIVLLDMDSTESALEYAGLAVEVNREAGDRPTNRLMGSLKTAGDIALATGRFDLADSSFSELLSARRSLLKTVFGYTSESEKLAYISQYPPIISTVLGAALENPGPDMRKVAIDMVLKGKGMAIDALASERAAAMCSYDPTIDSLIHEHKIICTEIARLALSGRSGEEDVLMKLDDLYSEKDRLEIDLSVLCSNLDFKLDDISVSSSSVASKLPENSVLWEFVKYHKIDLARLYRGNASLGEFYMAITLSPDENYDFIDLGVASLIDSLIEEYHSIMSVALKKHLESQADASDDQLSEVSAELYNRLVAPLENTLNGIDEVYIAADGAINLIPFETLTNDGERYLIEDHRFVYLTSGRDLLKEKSGSESRDVIVMADPDYLADPAAFPVFTAAEASRVFASRGNREPPECLGSLFSPLPMTRREGQSITHLLEQTDTIKVFYYDSGEAREGILKDHQRAPRILHLATHGYFCEQAQNKSMSNPLLRSGLLLAGANRTIGQLEKVRSDAEDGVLTALEVSGLNLIGTDLVVLSACQTGMGEVQNGEGVFGLRRAFQHAGARSLIMSMLDVPDEATSTLMERFYANWLSGKSKSTALRDASLSILSERRKREGEAHPIFWGGFVLVGDPE
ncbi:MAG: CHAT domain-containing protein [Candidatus Zixiibacteriota bacterium]|nr:MAG: CHAT domain-containing protein [candidate division Zixibacteria bacterium]